MGTAHNLHAIAGISGNYPSLSYTYRTDTGNAVTYEVERSYDLSGWTVIQDNDGTTRTGVAFEISAPSDNGDGTWKVGIRSNINFTTQPKQFFRVKATE